MSRTLFYSDSEARILCHDPVDTVTHAATVLGENFSGALLLVSFGVAEGAAVASPSQLARSVPLGRWLRGACYGT